MSIQAPWQGKFEIIMILNISQFVPSEPLDQMDRVESFTEVRDSLIGLCVKVILSFQHLVNDEVELYIQIIQVKRQMCRHPVKPVLVNQCCR